MLCSLYEGHLCSIIGSPPGAQYSGVATVPIFVSLGKHIEQHVRSFYASHDPGSLPPSRQASLCSQSLPHPILECQVENDPRQASNNFVDKRREVLSGMLLTLIGFCFLLLASLVLSLGTFTSLLMVTTWSATRRSSFALGSVVSIL